MVFISYKGQSFLKEIKKLYTSDSHDFQKVGMFTSRKAAVIIGKWNVVAKC